MSCLQSAPPRSRKRYNIGARAERKEKAGSLPKSRRKERALALCKVTYIAARARETERNARIVLAARIFAMVHRSCPSVSRPARKDGSALAGEPRRFERKRRKRRWEGTEEGGVLILLENISRLCVCVCAGSAHVSRRRRDVISRARSRRGVNTSESGAALLSY